MTRLLALALTAALTVPVMAQDDMMEDDSMNDMNGYDERAARNDAYGESVYADDSEWFGPQEGEWEMTLAGSGTSDEEFENGAFNLTVDASRYFSEMLSAGVRQNVGFSDFGESNWTGSTSVFGQLHFGDAKLRPFVGLELGYLYGDNVTDTAFGGPEAGLRYYVKPEAFIFGRASYQFLFDSGDALEDQFEDGRFVYTLGLGFTF